MKISPKCQTWVKDNHEKNTNLFVLSKNYINFAEKNLLSLILDTQ